MKYFYNVIFLLLIAACGFQPVYGVHSDKPSMSNIQLNEIAIETIPDYEGQFLRNLLVDRFHTNGTPKAARYRLSASEIGENIVELDITKTATATRAQMQVGTTITLYDTQENKAVLSRNVNARTSYNILGSEFATRVTEQNARENALKDLAHQIETQVMLYLNNEG